MVEILFEKFKEIDMRVGRVIQAEHIPKSRNLIKLEVDFGNEKRQAVSGIFGHYQPKELLDKKFIFILNLEKKKFMGIESECMILAAEDSKGNVILLKPEKEIEEGSRIR